ncbi:hypothetical protein [Paenibacillus sonchi]|uniref:hypothetical protein n=1 Tax=Paenibacillus sonchi TaxID=373687 RepID=UPI00030EA55E|nr:hypothetical protein [Paenibacillus sonchi]
MAVNNQNELVLKATAVLESLASGDPGAITNYIHPDQYIQHNQALPDGRAAMLGALNHLQEIGTKVLKTYEFIKKQINCYFTCYRYCSHLHF